MLRNINNKQNKEGESDRAIREIKESNIFLYYIFLCVYCEGVLSLLEKTLPWRTDHPTVFGPRAIDIHVIYIYL